jgi:hypothetical protein
VGLENGVAMFSNLQLGRQGRGYAIKANAGSGLASTKTAAFSVVSGAQNSVKRAVLLVRLAPKVKARAQVKRNRAHGRG